MEYKILELLLSSRDSAVENVKRLKTICTNDKQSYLITTILNLISDSGGYIKDLGAERAIRLFNLAKEYIDLCQDAYLDFIIDKDDLSNLIKYSSVVVYKVHAGNGDRLATTYEIDYGVRELYTEKINQLDSTSLNNLNLLLWTFTGRIRYYNSTGLKCNYTNEGERIENDYELIKNAAWKLKELFDWIKEDSQYKHSLDNLRQNKNTKIAYASYAEDEIQVNDTPKFILHACINKIYKKPRTYTQRKVSRLLFELEKSKRKALPEEISLMREAYNEYKRNIVEDAGVWKNVEIASLCKKLEKGIEDGLVRSGIVADIIEKSRLYGSLSDKQLEVLKNAEKMLDDRREQAERENRLAEKKKRKEKEDSNNDSEEDELVSLYDALGNGLLG